MRGECRVCRFNVAYYSHQVWCEVYRVEKQLYDYCDYFKFGGNKKI